MTQRAVVSALYPGVVAHTRLRPVRHRLRHRMLAMLIDLDELPELARRLPFFSLERFNLVSFHARDHLDGGGGGGGDDLRAELCKAGIETGGGAIRLFCMPRILGTVFNPLSIFFCHGADGDLRALLYEVRNTFGQRHSYLIPVDNQSAAGPIRQSCEKRFYVSPFMEMTLTYQFRLATPGERFSVAIDVRDGSGLILTAAFHGARQELSTGALVRGFLRHPLQAAQVLGAIHWEALLLFAKGMRIKPRPPTPENAVTVVSARPAETAPAALDRSTVKMELV